MGHASIRRKLLSFGGCGLVRKSEVSFRHYFEWACNNYLAQPKLPFMEQRAEDMSLSFGEGGIHWGLCSSKNCNHCPIQSNPTVTIKISPHINPILSKVQTFQFQTLLLGKNNPRAWKLERKALIIQGKTVQLYCIYVIVCVILINATNIRYNI